MMLSFTNGWRRKLQKTARLKGGGIARLPYVAFKGTKRHLYKTLIDNNPHRNAILYYDEKGELEKAFQHFYSRLAKSCCSSLFPQRLLRHLCPHLFLQMERIPPLSRFGKFIILLI